MKTTKDIFFYTFLIKLLLITIALLHLPKNSVARICQCNICSEGDECIISDDDKESTCYKSVEKILDTVNNTWVLSASYGCFRGGGSLGFMQCRTQKLKHNRPVWVRCCKHNDYCNDDLPDPSIQDDPRWDLNSPSSHSTDKISTLSNDEALTWLEIILGASLIMMCASVITCCIAKSIKSRSSKTSQASTCSIKKDVFDIHKFIVNGPESMHSCSTSVDLSVKHETRDSSHQEMSSAPVEVTSGHGEVMLSRRTMAREVQSNKREYVGTGRFGSVFRGEYHGDDVAVKAFNTIDSQAWSREEKIYQMVSHENILRHKCSEIVPVGVNEQKIWMYLEYCPYGSLSDFLDNNVITSPQQAIKIINSIIQGLAYLHEDYSGLTGPRYKSAIAHRDLKSKNVLMMTPELCKLADFGHALIKIDEHTLDYGKYQHLQVGTIRYMAPEILRPNSSVNYRDFRTFALGDVYQFGLIVWEVCQRTYLDIIYPAGPHLQPYEHVVPPNPALTDMIKIVCDDGYRPPRYEKWNKYPLMRTISLLLEDCWRQRVVSRMSSLGLKMRIKELYLREFPQEKQRDNLATAHTSPTLKIDKTRSIDQTM